MYFEMSQHRLYVIKSWDAIPYTYETELTIYYHKFITYRNDFMEWDELSIILVLQAEQGIQKR